MNRLTESCGDRSPLLGLLVGGVVVLLAQIVPFLTGLNSSQIPTTHQAAGTCLYEVFEDGICLGTVLCDRAQTIPKILHMMGRSDLGRRVDLERCAPCGSSLRFASNSSEMMMCAISGAKLMAAGKRIDLNRAQASDLSCIPGIGPKMAERIVLEREHRNGFKSVNDLRTIHGIGEKKWQTLAQWLEIDSTQNLGRFAVGY